MTELEIISRIEKGEICGMSQEELVSGANLCLKVSAKTAAVLAVVIAQLRKDYITDVTAWSSFCKENFKLGGSYLHHLHKIGKMLIVTCDYNVSCYNRNYTMLFNLDTDKQLSIARIPADRIDTFIKLQTKPLGKMTRGEIRAAVNLFLKKDVEDIELSQVTPKTANSQLTLPGFTKWLDSFETADAEAVISVVTDDNTAGRSLNAGITLMAAAISYHCNREVIDFETLCSLKAALLDEVQSIENILAQE